MYNSNNYYFCKYNYHTENGYRIIDDTLIIVYLSSNDLIQTELSQMKEDITYSYLFGNDAYDVPQDVDYYEFMVSEASIYAIYSQYPSGTGTADFYGTLYERATYMDSDDNSGSGNNFYIEANLTPNVLYRISVSGADTKQSGEYVLIIANIGGN